MPSQQPPPVDTNTTATPVVPRSEIRREPTPVGPAVPIPTIPLSKIDREPAPVSAATTPVVVIPLSSIDTAPDPLPVTTEPTVIPLSAIDVAPGAVTEDPIADTATTVVAADVALPSETVLPPPPPPSIGVVRSGPIYLPVAQDGNVVVPRTALLNFLGNGVTVTSVNGLIANIAINGNGTADLGNWAFVGNTQYNFNGGLINNSDLSHGATAMLGLPANGDGNAVELLNYYGSLSLTAGTGPGQTKNWTFGSDGVLTAPDAITTMGNITASYFLGNGSQLTGVYGNANLVAYLPTYTGNIGAGNVNLNNGSRVQAVTNNINLQANINGAVELKSHGGNYTWAFDNYGWAQLPEADAAYTPVANGSVLFTPTALTLKAGFANLILDNSGNTTTGNYFLGNVQGLVGSITNLDSLNFSVENISALVGNNGVNIGAGGFNNLVVLPTEVLIQNVPLNTTGNISANYFIGNGSLLTGIAATYGNANVAANLAAFGSNPISTTGNITTTANISGAYVKGNGSELTNLPAPVVTQDISSNGAMSIMLYDGTIKYNNYATVEPVSGNITGGNILTGGLISASGNITGNYFIGDGSQLTNLPGGGGNTGNVTFSDQIVIGTGNPEGGDGLYLAPGPDSIANSTVQYLRVRGGDNVTHIHLDTGNNAYYDQYFGADTKYVKLEANGNIVINADDGANSATWTFGSAGAYGELTLPAGEGIIKALDDTIALVSLNTTTGNANSVYLGSGGGLGFNDQDIGGNWLEIFRSGTEPEIRVPVGRGNLNIQTAQGNTAYDWVFDNTGNLTTPGAIIGAGSNVELVAGSYTATFDTTGVLTVPGNITGADVVTANTFVSNAFNVVTAGNLSITSQYGLGFTGTILEDNGTLELIGSGEGGVVVGWDSTYGNGLGNIATVNFNEVGGEGILLRTGNRAATEYNWNFDSTGNLTLPGNIAGNTGGYAIGYRDIPQVTFSANATAALADAGKHFYSTTAGNLALTLPDNSTVAMPTGATLTVVVNAAGNVLINQGTSVSLYMAGSATTGNRVLGAYGLASVMKVAANTWVISGTGVY